MCLILICDFKLNFLFIFKSVADKCNVQNCMSNTVQPLIDTQMKYHTTFYKVPQFLKSMIADVLQVKHTNTEHITPLHDDVSF